MLKRITCLLAVLIVLFSCVPIVFALDAPLPSIDDYSLAVQNALSSYKYIALFSGPPYAVHNGKRSSIVVASDEPLTCTVMDEDSLKITTSAACYRAWNEVEDNREYFQSYEEATGWIASLTYVNANYPITIDETVGSIDKDQSITIGGAYAPPEYNLENDWLSQTTDTADGGKPEEGIYIIAPKDGKVFSSKDSYANITVQYRHLLNPLYINPHINIYASYDGTNFENLDLSFADGLYDLNMVNQNTNVVAYGSDRYFEATITYRLSPRKNLQVTVYCDLMYQKNAGILTQPTLLAESNRVTMTWYDDFVDADGDGVDDRDNQPDYSPSQDYDKDNGVNVDGINDVTGLLDSTKGSIEGVIGFVKYYFSFIPSQVFTIISASLVICILLRIFGR